MKRKLNLMVDEVATDGNFHQVFGGDIIAIKKKSPMLLACCDCGMVHKIAMLSRRNDILLFFAGGERETKKLRKQRKFAYRKGERK